MNEPTPPRGRGSGFPYFHGFGSAIAKKSEAADAVYTRGITVLGRDQLSRVHGVLWVARAQFYKRPGTPGTVPFGRQDGGRKNCLDQCEWDDHAPFHETRS